MRPNALLVVALFLICASRPLTATWTQVTTPNFLLIGDARAGEMRRVAARFEQFHAVMQHLLSREAVSSTVPVVILVFANEHSFRPYMPLHEGKPMDVAGMLWSGRDVNYVAVNVEHGERSYQTIFHELTHIITYNVLRQPPLWFVEGVAEYYSTFELRGSKEVFLGRPILDHVRILRSQLLPLRELLSAGDESRAYTDRARRTIFYAQSWALVHYLRGNPQTRPGINHFLRLIDSGMPQEQALREAFTFDVPALEKALESYVRRFQVPMERWTLAKPVSEAALTSDAVGENIARTHLGRVLMRTDRLSEAEQHFKEALAGDAGLPLAHVSVAQLGLKQGQADDAWTRLAAAPESTGFLDHYLTAITAEDYLNTVGEESESREKAAAAMRTHAGKAVGARADLAEAWRVLARAALLGHELPVAADAIGRALAMAPADESYRFTLATVLGRQREFVRARRVLGELMAHGRTQRVRQSARQFMSSLVTYERQFSDTDAVPEAPAPGQGTSAVHDKQPAAVTLVFRKVERGETRVFAVLTTITCAAGEVTLVVELAPGRQLRITAPGFPQIDFITYRDDLTGTVGCAPRTPPDSVYVTWPGAMPEGDSIRVPKVAVEFMPRGFTPNPR